MSAQYRRLALDKVASTNDEAMARMRAGDPDGLIVTARMQTCGRGRQGRTWVSPVGNLYLSLALRNPSATALAPQLGFVAGVALAQTPACRLGGDPKLRLKWPNDALYDGAKLSGILLESSVLPDGSLACVIGVGVNCRSHPNDLAYRVTDLGASGDPDPDCDAVLVEFIRCFDIQLRIWDRGAGFDAIRRSWLSFAAGLGSQVEVTTSRGCLSGAFKGLDAAGRLLLDTGTGLVCIDAGDVFFPALAATTHHDVAPRAETMPMKGAEV